MRSRSILPPARLTRHIRNSSLPQANGKLSRLPTGFPKPGPPYKPLHSFFSHSTNAAARSVFEKALAVMSSVPPDIYRRRKPRSKLPDIVPKTISKSPERKQKSVLEVPKFKPRSISNRSNYSFIEIVPELSEKGSTPRSRVIRELMNKSKMTSLQPTQGNTLWEESEHEKVNRLAEDILGEHLQSLPGRKTIFSNVRLMGYPGHD